MEVLEIFPEVEPLSPPEETKIRKPRKKDNRYSKEQNRRRYSLHRKVKDYKIQEIKLFVRKRVIELPVMFDIEQYPALKELIYNFKYHAPTEFLPKE